MKTFLISGGGILIGGVMVTSFGFTIRIKSVDFRYMLVAKMGTIEVYSVGFLVCASIDMVESTEDFYLLGISG